MEKVIFVFAFITCITHASAQQETRNDGTSRYRNHPDLPSGIHAAAYSGAWIPHGNLSSAGSHGYIGFQVGASNMIPKVSINISSTARLGNMPQAIKVKKDDSVYQSTNYAAANFGLDGAYSVIGRETGNFYIHSLDILGGIGVDVQRILSEKRQETKIKRTLFSPDINAGLGYKCWFGKTYIGLDVKYHFLFYKNEGGTNLSGNAITIGLILGHVLTFD
jgi:hypothetical protein